MNKDITYLTQKGLDELKKELYRLIHTDRIEIAETIRIAKEYGDLSENAEYQEAKNKQAFLEGKIQKLQKMVANVQIIDNSKSIQNVVNLGDTVTIRYISSKREMTFVIVGSAESAPLEGKISNESPIGSALLNHSVGEILDVPTPGGLKKVEILKVK